MKNVQLLYNPKAGDTLFKTKLDRFLQVFISKGFSVSIYRSEGLGKMTEYLEKTDLSETEIVFVAGGDGTVNEIVNVLMKLDQDKRPILGVIPAGTCNDFASSLGFNLDLDSCIDAMGKLQTLAVDVGQVNGQYFINVCGAGLFTNVSQNINNDLKNMFGRMAYYVAGLGSMATFKPFHLKVESDGKTYEDEFFLFVVLNSAGAGSIHLATEANLSDGVYDFVGIKAVPISELAPLLIKLMQQKHLNDKNVLFFQSDNFKISSNDISDRFRESDVDGESGPDLPLDIKVYKQALRVLTNFEK